MKCNLIYHWLCILNCISVTIFAILYNQSSAIFNSLSLPIMDLGLNMTCIGDWKLYIKINWNSYLCSLGGGGGSRSLWRKSADLPYVVDRLMKARHRILFITCFYFHYCSHWVELLISTRCSNVVVLFLVMLLV